MWDAVPLVAAAPRTAAVSVADLRGDRTHGLHAIGPRARAAWCFGGADGHLRGHNAAALTVGATARHDRNEDGVALLTLYPDDATADPIELAFVADGVGGAPCGHLASAVAIQSALNLIARDYSGEADLDAVCALVARAVRAAQQILKLAKQPKAYSPNTTFLASVSQGHRGCFLHVGDSTGVAVDDLRGRATACTIPDNHAVVPALLVGQWDVGTVMDRQWTEVANSIVARNLTRSVLTHDALTVTPWEIGAAGGWILAGTDGALGNWGVGNFLHAIAAQGGRPWDALVVDVCWPLIAAIQAVDASTAANDAAKEWTLFDSALMPIDRRVVHPDDVTFYLKRVTSPLASDTNTRALLLHRLRTLLPATPTLEAHVHRLALSRCAEALAVLAPAPSAYDLATELQVIGVLP